jgi:glycosyltransferase involved in cell wall biosynthesis
MKVSFTSAPEHMITLKDEVKDLVGYSHASYQIMNAFERFGFTTSIKDKSAPLAISMGFPTDYTFAPNQYKIGYTAWESTQLRDGWLRKMKSCDEIWATSTWTANVFKETLNRENIHVYPHGIDIDWKPIRRKNKKPFRFLHVGEPQIRKNGQLVVDTFIELFGNNPDYELVLKCSGMNSTRLYENSGSIIGSPDSKYKNINILTIPLTHSQMIELYYKTHALIYPTAGEGFGFIPLQALATGMPTISTYQWAEYQKYITIPLEAELGPSIHEELHPGLTYNVDKDFLKKSMIDMVENYEKYQKEAYKNSFHVHMEYDWDRVTEPTAKHLKNIFKSRGF